MIKPLYLPEFGVVACLWALLSHVLPTQAAPKDLKGWIVSRSDKGMIQADAIKGKDHRNLRGYVGNSGNYDNAWDISPDGKCIAFSSAPNNVEIWWRAADECLFEQRFNEPKPRLLIASQGGLQKDAFALGNENSDTPRWDFQSSGLMVCHGEYQDQITPRAASFFDPIHSKMSLSVPSSSLPAAVEKRAQSEAVIDAAKSKIVYISQSPCSMGNDIGLQETDWNYRLFLYDARMDTSHILLTSSTYIRHLRLNRDGRSCVFEQGLRRKDEVWLSAIFQVNLNNGKVSQLTHPQRETDSYPDFSPDGRWIVWKRENLDGKNLRLRHKLCVMNADGSNQRPVSYSFNGTGLRWIAKLPDWSRYSKVPIIASVVPVPKQLP